MSMNPIKDFIPSVFEFASSATDTRFLKFLNFIFPDSPRIPIVHIKIFGWDFVDLRWPVVAILAILGFVLSIINGKRLFQLSRSGRRFRGSLTWSFALFWYALMCIGGLGYHCISNLYLFHQLDVLGTACSSASIVAGCLRCDDLRFPCRIFLMFMYISFTFATLNGSTMVTELLYLVPSLVAVPAGLFGVYTLIFREMDKKESDESKGVKKKKNCVKKWAYLTSTGALVAVVGMISNQWITNNLLFGWDIGAIAWFFAGSNLATLSIARMFAVANDTFNLR